MAIPTTTLSTASAYASESQSPLTEDQLHRIWQQDADLAICTTCGNQYPVERGPIECPICYDDRQYPCPTGQAYTTSRQLVHDAHTTFRFVPESFDTNIVRVQLEPPVGIGQTPILLVTKHGIIIWDCCGFVSVELIQAVQRQSPTGKALAIFISHPHFYGSSLTWASMLDCQVYISNLDRQWYLRGLDPLVRPQDFSSRQRYVVEVDSDVFRLPDAPAFAFVRCGGHFPGSSVLHWDRDRDMELDQSANARPGAAVFCSDTFMVALDRKRFTFAYSFPNLIPLPPTDVAHIWNVMKQFDWQATFGGWPGRNILADSRSILLQSARHYIRMEGHDPDGFKLSV